MQKETKLRTSADVASVRYVNYYPSMFLFLEDRVDVGTAQLSSVNVVLTKDSFGGKVSCGRYLDLTGLCEAVYLPVSDFGL